jgi:hypothetical protein
METSHRDLERMKNMKKRNIKSVYDIGSLPVTEVNRIEGHITNLRDFQKQYDAEENAKTEAKLMAPVRAAEIEVKQAAGEHANKIQHFYSRPLSLLKDIGIELAPNDLSGDYPLAEGTRDSKAEVATYEAFKSDLASRGCALSDTGWARLGSYLAVLVYNRNISLASVDSWAIGLERLSSLGCFADGEITGYAAAVAAQEARKPKPVKPEPTFDELLDSVSGESREGRKALINAAVDAALTGEIRQTWSAFEESLYRNFNGFVLTRKQSETIYKAMISQGMNLLRPTDYDKVRVALVRSGDLPKHLLYPQEIICIDMESADMNDLATRQEFNRRARQLSS